MKVINLQQDNIAITSDFTTSLINNREEVVKTKNDKKNAEYLRSYLLKLLGGKDYSESDLIKKSILKGFSSQDFLPIIEDFKSKKWIDDIRYSENIVHYYQGKKGINWIKQKLFQKGISKEIVQNLFSQNSNNLEPDQNVKLLLERKHKITNWSNIDIKVKNKVLYFLSSRGFSSPFKIIQIWQNNLS